MRHAYVLRKFNRIGPPEELDAANSILWDPEALERASRQIREAMPITEEIRRGLADAANIVSAMADKRGISPVADMGEPQDKPRDSRYRKDSRRL